MLKTRSRWQLYAVAASAALLLGACTPRYDWREVRGTGAAPFVVLLPAKPSTLSHPIELNGTPLTMSMTAAKVGQVAFAVGSAELPDAGAAEAALDAMKSALVGNIGGTVRQQKTTPAAGAGHDRSLEIEAVGRAGDAPVLLAARFIAHRQYVYQVVLLGPEKSITRDMIDTFLSSFKID